MLSRYQSNPGLDHWRAAKKVMRYLKGTMDYMLTYRRSDQLEVIAYSDADFSGCLDTRKSTTGYIFLLAGGAITWCSEKQSITVTSTMAAEFIACFEASSQAIQLRNLLIDLPFINFISRPIKIYCDNSAAVFFSKNNKATKGGRSLDIKYFALRDRVKNHEVSI